MDPSDQNRSCFLVEKFVKLITSYCGSAGTCIMRRETVHGVDVKVEKIEKNYCISCLRVTSSKIN